MFNDLTEGIEDLGNHYHHKYIYYENGQVKTEINYKDGVLISEKCWDEKGKEIECE